MRVLVFAVAAFVCIIAHTMILVSVSRRGSVLADTAVPRPRRRVEILWALVPAMVLALVLLATWRHVSDQEAAKSPPDVIMKLAR